MRQPKPNGRALSHRYRDDQRHSRWARLGHGRRRRLSRQPRARRQSPPGGDLTMDALWKDLSLAIRQFRRQPAFVLAVVSTLALAIGANIAVFSVVNAVLFRALPFTAPERLVWIVSVRP